MQIFIVIVVLGIAEVSYLNEGGDQMVKTNLRIPEHVEEINVVEAIGVLDRAL